MRTPITTNLQAMFGPTAPARLLAILKESDGPFSYLRRYWTTQNFSMYLPDATAGDRPLYWLLSIGMGFQAIIGIVLVYRGLFANMAGGLFMGLALLLSYQLLWAHVLFVVVLVLSLTKPKTLGKAILCRMLESQVRQLRKRNDFTIIAVAGSVGKTSTKLAIAKTLEASGKRVRYQEGNYNDRLTVPLVLFGSSEPGIFDIPAWFRILRRNYLKLEQPFPFDFAVIELGTDGPGQMAKFAYLRPELTVLTAVTEEHMEYFKTLEGVAAEECAVFDYSAQVLVNTDDVANHYLKSDSYVSYGMNNAEYTAVTEGDPSLDGQKIKFSLRGSELTVSTKYLGKQGAKVLLAAAAVAHMVEVETPVLIEALSGLQPFAGRMQLLPGIQESTLIDDTYNASPTAVLAALDVLYSIDAPQRIAVLGSMNELGDQSADLHKQVGNYCDPGKLQLVVTIGNDARDYLAAAAEQVGCEVKSFSSPYDAAEFLKDHIKEHAVVLFKGSQNGVFAEEALKPLLNNPGDANKLVRQSNSWMQIKHSQFGG